MDLDEEGSDVHGAELDDEEVLTGGRALEQVADVVHVDKVAQLVRIVLVGVRRGLEAQPVRPGHLDVLEPVQGHLAHLDNFKIAEHAPERELYRARVVGVLVDLEDVLEPDEDLVLVPALEREQVDHFGQIVAETAKLEAVGQGARGEGSGVA